MDKKQAFLLRYVALAFAVLAPLRRFIGASDTPNLSCSEFRQTLAAGQVGDVVVKEDVAVGLLKADGLEAILPAAVVQSLNKQNDEPRFLTILLNAPDPMAQQGAPFLSPSGPEFVEMPACVSAVRVRDLLEQAARQAPCIVFIDELDAPGNRRMTIGKPDLKGRRQIIEVHARNVTLAPKPAPGSMAARTPGFAGADRASLVNEATLRAARYGKEALDRIITGPEKTNRVKIPMERRFVVFREAGHALVAELREATA